MGIPYRFQVYMLVQRWIKPEKWTPKYILLTSILVGSILSIGIGGLGYLLSLEYLYRLAVIVFGVSIVTTYIRVSFISTEKKHEEEAIVDTSWVLFLPIFVVTCVGGGLIWYFVPPTQITTVEGISIQKLLQGGPLLLLLGYWVYNFQVGPSYNGERKYYVNEYTPLKQRWEEASAVLEEGHTQLQKGHSLRSYYYFNKARERYEYLAEYGERETYRKVAEAHAEASQTYQQSLTVSKEESQTLFQKGNFYINRANEALQYRVCDDCGNRTQVKNIHRTVSMDGIEKNLYCVSCYNGEDRTEGEEEAVFENMDDIEGDFITEDQTSESKPTSQQTNTTDAPTENTTEETKNDAYTETEGVFAGEMDNLSFKENSDTNETRHSTDTQKTSKTTRTRRGHRKNRTQEKSTSEENQSFTTTSNSTTTTKQTEETTNTNEEQTDTRKQTNNTDQETRNETPNQRKTSTSKQKRRKRRRKTGPSERTQHKTPNTEGTSKHRTRRTSTPSDEPLSTGGPETTVSDDKTISEDKASQDKRTEQTDTSTKQSQKPERRFSDKTNRVTVEWACEVLEIEKPVTEDDVKKAFRTQIRNVHPDSGGTKEDFQKVQDARERLETYVKYTNN